MSDNNKGKTIASLGALPPGKRLIEYSHEYSKTYRNTYYAVVDEDWAEELERELDENYYNEYECWGPEARELASLEAECYDSYENGEKDEGVELLQATVKYDPSDADQRQAVERGWEDHISERDYEAVKQTQGAQR
jgi:hypothetical protein